MKPEPRPSDQRTAEMARERQDVEQDIEPRCPRNEGGCDKLLGLRLTRPWTIQCRRCGAIVTDGQLIGFGRFWRRRSS